MVSCKLGCGIKFPRSSQEWHINNECVKRPLTCQYCKASIPMEELQVWCGTYCKKMWSEKRDYFALGLIFLLSVMYNLKAVCNSHWLKRLFFKRCTTLNVNNMVFHSLLIWAYRLWVLHAVGNRLVHASLWSRTISSKTIIATLSNEGLFDRRVWSAYNKNPNPVVVFE